MNRYVRVQGLGERVGGDGDNTSVVHNVRYLIVDLTVFKVIADCGDDLTGANKVVQALNEFDGGPL